MGSVSPQTTSDLRVTGPGWLCPLRGGSGQPRRPQGLGGHHGPGGGQPYPGGEPAAGPRAAGEGGGAAPRAGGAAEVIIIMD